METININENNQYMVIEITDEKDVNLVHFSALPYEPESIKADQKKQCRLVEIQASGWNQNDHHDMKNTGTAPAAFLKYKGIKDYLNGRGRKIELELEYNMLVVVCHMQFYNGISIMRSWTEIINQSDDTFGLEYVSSFCLTGVVKEGMAPWDTKAMVYIPHNTWFGECQWRQYRLPELGLCHLNSFSMKKISVSSKGTWSTSQYLPMGILSNRECHSSLFWQIENNGAWQWEISDIKNCLYLQLAGPSQNENHWWKNLQPGQSFISVPVAIGSVMGGFDESIGEITKYRRAMRRPHSDNKNLPVIFNDYMNCLMGDPTEEKEIPLINAAAEAGCEYYVIDAGWYGEGDWWDSVGEWLPSEKRFPGGIKKIIDYIKSKHMVPGLWLEIEVVGINSPSKALPDDWFFIRHGKRVIDHGRYQLDFRNPAVRTHAGKIIDRLVKDYGIAYIKMDYNINAGIGTEHSADSFGDGLLSHNRAYLLWIEEILDKYPGLVIENCSSGGMRMDYALLSKHSIQSVSDQTDYRKNAVIAAASLSAVTPEQGALWSYPLETGDKEEVILNMINGMLCRIHQSGRLDKLSEENSRLVRQGIEYYKKIRRYIPEGIPFWPLGIPQYDDSWLSVGLNCGDRILLAVWKLEKYPEVCQIPLLSARNKSVKIYCGFPKEKHCYFHWSDHSTTLAVRFPVENSARLFEIIIQDDDD